MLSPCFLSCLLSALIAQALGNMEGERPCGWDPRYDDLGGCWIHKGALAKPGTKCYDTAFCVYKRLFTFIDEAAAAAKEVADVLVVSAMADVDALYEKIDRAGDVFAPSLDAWTAQVYRGDTFGDFFASMGNATSKPVLLTEYGVDAYHDECGADPSTTGPCYNTMASGESDRKKKSYVDEAAQAAYARNLTREIEKASSEYDGCATAKKGDTTCTAIGGFLMSWTDEYWKGAKSQASCAPTLGNEGFSPRKCDPKAHVTCGNWNASDHDLCGYSLDAAPDHYVNEEWFGITTPTQCAASIDALTPRQVYWDMRKEWSGKGKEEMEEEGEGGRGDGELFRSCEEMLQGQCAALGSEAGERAEGPSQLIEWIGWLVGGRIGSGRTSTSGVEADGSSSTRTGVQGGGGDADDDASAESGGMGDRDGGNRDGGGGPPSLPICSGRGLCTTDWRKCGAGSWAVAATPCCSCDFGYAGVGCGHIDVRLYVALGLAATLVALCGAMIALSMCNSYGRVLTPKESLGVAPGQGGFGFATGLDGLRDRLLPAGVER